MFTPHNQFLIIKSDKAVTTQGNGIVIPDKHQKSPFCGKLVAKAADCKSNDLVVGQTRVYFSQVGAGAIVIDGQQYIMVQETAILGCEPAPEYLVEDETIDAPVPAGDPKKPAPSAESLTTAYNAYVSNCATMHVTPKTFGEWRTSHNN